MAQAQPPGASLLWGTDVKALVPSALYFGFGSYNRRYIITVFPWSSARGMRSASPCQREMVRD